MSEKRVNGYLKKIQKKIEQIFQFIKACDLLSHAKKIVQNYNLFYMGKIDIRKSDEFYFMF